MEKKFKTLRVFAAIQIAIGVVFLLLAGFMLLVLVGAISSINDAIVTFVAGTSGIVAIVGLVLIGITSIAYGEFLQVIMQIEENTRKE